MHKSSSDYTNPEIWEEYWDDPQDHGKWVFGGSNDFSARGGKIPIQIELKESDVLIDPDDTADVSGQKGDDPSDIYGKIFDGIYDISTDQIEVNGEEKIQGPDSEGYYIICGEFDGRGTPDPTVKMM